MLTLFVSSCFSLLIIEVRIVVTLKVMIMNIRREKAASKMIKTTAITIVIAKEDHPEADLAAVKEMTQTKITTDMKTENATRRRKKFQTIP